MNDDATRCPLCGKRVSADASTCPACGYEFVARQSRIRCSHCGSRIAADSVKCPRCGADPHVSRVPRAARIGAIVFAALLLVCCSWVAFRAITTNTLSRALGLIDAPTRTLTPWVQITYVIATTVRPTATWTPNPTATPTSRFSPTPTRRGVRTATPAPTRSILAPGLYVAPQLIAPLNATVYEGPNAIIALQWQPSSPNGLRENEWYYVTLTFTAPDGSPGLRYGWSKETRWSVPNAWYTEAASDARTYKWNVAVMRIEGIDPLVSPSKTPASPTSVTRTFFWN